MAKEYIEREAVIKKCNKLLDNADSCPEQYILDGVKLVRDLILIDQETRVPSADVTPVVHGEWIPKTQGMEAPGGFYYWGSMKKVFVCSICGRVEKEQEPYCHCGARMDGGKNQ